MWTKVIIGLVLFYATVASANWGQKYNLPGVAKIEINRTLSSSAFHKIHLEFQWTSAEPPNFPNGTAVEFEVHINPKCFAQPIGGKDDNSKLTRIYGHNFPPEAKPYRDLWNYWIPESADDLIQRGVASCGELNWAEETGIRLRWEEIKRSYSERKYAGFAIGLKRADLLKPEVRYYFDYPIEVPLTAECLNFFDPKSKCKSNQANSGGAQVSMQYFDNTCTFLPVFGHTFSCPEFLGLKQCQGPNQTIHWLHRLCAPTGSFSFVPQPKDLVDWSGTECCDDDIDGLFAIQSLPMFGTRVGDCNDNDPKVDNEYYDRESNVCTMPMVTCVPDSRRCQGGVLYICSSTGTGEGMSSCPSGICYDGQSCKNIVCSPGTTRCTAGALYTCNPSGTGETFEPCPTGNCQNATSCQNAPSCLDICRNNGKNCGIYDNNCNCGNCSGTDVCVSNVCAGCGGTGSPCCPGRLCSGNLVCDNGNDTCRPDTAPLMSIYRFSDQCSSAHWSSPNSSCNPESVSCSFKS